MACRSSKAGAYIGAVTESPITAGAWTWGIYKKVGDESFEQLLGSGIDGEGPIPLTPNAPTLSLSLGCSRTVQGEQLMLYVGDELAGITVDIDRLGGAYTSLFTQPTTSGAPCSSPTSGFRRPCRPDPGGGRPLPARLRVLEGS